LESYNVGGGEAITSIIEAKAWIKAKLNRRAWRDYINK
jgi:hypothetical protein